MRMVIFIEDKAFLLKQDKDSVYSLMLKINKFTQDFGKTIFIMGKVALIIWNRKNYKDLLIGIIWPAYPMDGLAMKVYIFIYLNLKKKRWIFKWEDAWKRYIILNKWWEIWRWILRWYDSWIRRIHHFRW